MLRTFVQGGSGGSARDEFSVADAEAECNLADCMSLVALLLVLGNVALHGAMPPSDEGQRRIFGRSMAGQAPIVAYFAIRWLRPAPKQTIFVLAEQAGAALASLAAVFFLSPGVRGRLRIKGFFVLLRIRAQNEQTARINADSLRE